MNIIKLDTTKSIIKPPTSQRLKSGLVVLKKGEEIGPHSTDEKEEMIIILKGEAILEIEGDNKKIQPGHIVYIPKNTGHNVRNDSEVTLKYIYITALLD